jgi:hypothetical protein
MFLLLTVKLHRVHSFWVNNYRNLDETMALFSVLDTIFQPAAISCREMPDCQYGVRPHLVLIWLIVILPMESMHPRSACSTVCREPYFDWPLSNPRSFYQYHCFPYWLILPCTATKLPS